MKKHKRKEFTFPALLGIGVGLSLGAVAFTSLMLAVVSYFTKDPTSLTSAFTLLSLILAGAISGFVISRVNTDGGVPLSILSSVISALLILAVGLIWKKGFLPLSVTLNVLAFVSASILASLLGGRKKQRTRYRK